MFKYRDYKLIKPNSTQKNQIDGLVDESLGSVFHETALNEIAGKYFGTDLFYLVNDEDKISDFSPVHVIKRHLVGHEYHLKPLKDIPYSGFLSKKKVLPEEFRIGFFDSVIYSGLPFERGSEEIYDPKEVGLTSMVDLSLDETEIFDGVLHSKRRNMVRKARKSGISIEYFKDKKGLDIIRPMIESLHSYLGYEIDFNYYLDLFEKYAKIDQAFVLIAFKDTEPLSGVFILGNKNIMHYYKGVSDSNLKNEGQGELLQWEAILKAKELGSKYYDLCNLDPVNLSGIYKFKTGICNELYTFQKYKNSKFGFKLRNRLEKLLW